MTPLLAALAAALMASSAAAQETTGPTDLRNLAVGMPASALQPEGYAGFACAADPAVRLDGWASYPACPADASGQREVSFRYGDTLDGATKVAGQPMLLSLTVGPAGTVQAIHMRTDPAARLYQHKRAYIFGLQVMARYGQDGWACTEAPPTAAERPVGGMFVRQHCEKAIAARRLVVDRELYRQADDAPAAFTSGSRFTVSLAKADAS